MRLPEISVTNLLRRFVREDRGQDLIEYSLLAAFIALVSIGAVEALGTQLNTTYDSIGTKVAAMAAAAS
jgi:pilus assembly protein Flp/PilA